MHFSQCIVNTFIQVSQMLWSDSALSECGLFAPVPFEKVLKRFMNILFCPIHVCSVCCSLGHCVSWAQHYGGVCEKHVPSWRKLGIFSLCLHHWSSSPLNHWIHAVTRRVVFTGQWDFIGTFWLSMPKSYLIILLLSGSYSTTGGLIKEVSMRALY